MQDDPFLCVCYNILVDSSQEAYYYNCLLDDMAKLNLKIDLTNEFPDCSKLNLILKIDLTNRISALLVTLTLELLLCLILTVGYAVYSLQIFFFIFF